MNEWSRTMAHGVPSRVPLKKTGIEDEAMRWVGGDLNQWCYQVPFEHAFRLIKTRAVVVSAGIAFVPMPLMIGFLTDWFGDHLSQKLQVMSRILQCASKDGRVTNALYSIRERLKEPLKYVPNKSADGEINRYNVGTLSNLSFPLCMKRMHQKLLQDSHLRYWGRRTYGLFLKGIGLSLEEAIEFWRSAFSPKFDRHTWEKKYAYNIRHNYGKVGKCADYSPYDCKKIISSSAQGPNEFHTCPFKDCDSQRLRELLKRDNIDEAHIEEILNRKTSSRFLKACQAHFRAKHDMNLYQVDMTGIGQHPNVYFDQSRIFHSHIASKLFAHQQ